MKNRALRKTAATFQMVSDTISHTASRIDNAWSKGTPSSRKLFPFPPCRVKMCFPFFAGSNLTYFAPTFVQFKLVLISACSCEFGTYSPKSLKSSAKIIFRNSYRFTAEVKSAKYMFQVVVQGPSLGKPIFDFSVLGKVASNCHTCSAFV